MSNSAGNTSRDIRKFLRDNGEKVTMEKVERIQREVSRTQQENERMEKFARDSGMAEREREHKRRIVQENVRREMKQRKRR